MFLGFKNISCHFEHTNDNEKNPLPRDRGDLQVYGVDYLRMLYSSLYVISRNKTHIGLRKRNKTHFTIALL
jgi:hypothetical protein